MSSEEVNETLLTVRGLVPLLVTFTRITEERFFISSDGVAEAPTALAIP